MDANRILARLRVERRAGPAFACRPANRDANLKTRLGEFDLHPFSPALGFSARGAASSPSNRCRPSGKKFPSSSSRRCCRRRPSPKSRSRRNKTISRASSSPCRTRRTSTSAFRPSARSSCPPRSRPRRRRWPRVRIGSLSNTGAGGERPEPPYPPIALETGEQGTVILLLSGDDGGQCHFRGREGIIRLSRSRPRHGGLHQTSLAASGRRRQPAF